jgi:hypothetical protein
MKSKDKSVGVARVFFAICVLFLAWAVAGAAGFDGVVIRGLNANLGVRPRGVSIIHTLHFGNFTLDPVTILQKPTCGCESPYDEALTLKPFHSGELNIAYYISPKEKGLRKRTILLYIKRGDDAYKKEGTVSFTLQ